MVYISTGAAVALAKAGKAYSEAQRKAREHRAQGKHASRIDEIYERLSATDLAYSRALTVVMAELYAQNLHDMTDPA